MFKNKIISMRVNRNPEAGLFLVTAYLFSNVRKCEIENTIVSLLRKYAQNKVGNWILSTEPKTIAIVQSGSMQQVDLTFEAEGIN